ncbi:DUF4349 domain-containing protein [Hymenobacter terrenus]|uniref:DUF4349 domain-containing protein n=1 Tax=Hymenobacter terrenus TaxID=1629124 RepID=UPI00061A0381|nr:DUF4349 domain-containing protein [Hymenobacter terrenus]
MKYTLGVIYALAVLLSSCSQSHQAESSAEAEVASAAEPAPDMAPPPTSNTVNFTPPVQVPDDASGANTPNVNARLGKPAPSPTPRLLIYHADMRLKVVSLPKASARLDSLVRQSGGYTSASTETRENGEWHQETTIRVRPNRFGTLLATLAGLGTVEEKKLTTDDVTAEHADVAARLRTKRALEQRYLTLLNQAKKVSDMLEIEEKIGEVREEIESTESRLKTLNDEVSYSSITLTCYQPLPEATPDAPVVSLGSRLVGAMYSGWSSLISLVIGAVSSWPLLLLGAGVWWAVRRWQRRTGLKSI